MSLVTGLAFLALGIQTGKRIKEIEDKDYEAFPSVVFTLSILVLWFYMLSTSL